MATLLKFKKSIYGSEFDGKNVILEYLSNGDYIPTVFM